MKNNQNLPQYLDHTLLRANATLIEIKNVCQEAQKYNFQAVCINPFYVPIAAKFLKSSKVKVCTVIGFPLGANDSTIKIQEAQAAIIAGAQEIDMVINIGALKDNNQTLVVNEIKAIRKVCGANIILKVIIECSLLTTEQKIIACELVALAEADFIKTSTGFANGGATIADVELLKKHLPNNIGIKASGGIKTQSQMIALIAAGATRIGTSNGIAIINDSNVENDY